MEKKDIDKLIGKTLAFDALANAEEVTGKSYKTDKETESLGFITHIAMSQAKEGLLSSLGDSTFSNTEESYLRIVKSIGFDSLLVQPFTNKDGIEERFHILWHDEFSILMVFDTFTWGDDGSWAKSGIEVPPPNVNGCNFYYNWSPTTDDHLPVSSGSYVSNGDENFTYGCEFNQDFTPHIIPEKFRLSEPKLDWDNYDDYQKRFKEWCLTVKEYTKEKGLISIWSGNHDGREAIKYKIRTLDKAGNFLKVWCKTPHLWLIHSGDAEPDKDLPFPERSKIFDDYTNSRLRLLPPHVLKAMNIKLDENEN